ncbi:MAG: phosphotransferase family protein [Haloechinothrix sp.]
MFAKGTRADNPQARQHRIEARIAPWLPVLAPRLLWQIEKSGWLLLGFEHVAGRHANLSPGSDHLPLIAHTVSELTRELTPSPVDGLPTLGEKMARMSAWRRLRDDPPAGLDPWARTNLDTFAQVESRAIDQVSGDTLLHTDLHSLNLLIADTARPVDWAWAHIGADWADPAYLVIRMIEAGNTPEHAEQWARSIEAWADASPAALTAFAVEVYGMWEYLRHARPLPARETATQAARQCAQHRLSTHGTCPANGL